MKYFYLLVLWCCLGVQLKLYAQKNITVKGRVYDITAKIPLEAVTVFSTSGHNTFTDSLGFYQIQVGKKDSIWFSLLNKTTQKYPVDTIYNTDNFDIAIALQANNLPPVTVRNRSYRLDSIQNRLDYAKVFNYKKPGIRLSPSNAYNTATGGIGVGIDLEELINIFRFKRNKSILKLQERLIKEEQDKYVDKRFSKLMVRRLTNLISPGLENFMNKYRPSYFMVLALNDLELGYYVQQCFKHFKGEPVDLDLMIQLAQKAKIFEDEFQQE